VSVRFLDAAHEELVEAHRFYDEAGAGVAHAFVVEVADAVSRIARYPNAWQILSGHWRRCLLRRFPYGLIYVQADHELLVVAVAHLHRRPNYWCDRTL
jgi:plasmid stabilization system protein ParE